MRDHHGGVGSESIKPLWRHDGLELPVAGPIPKRCCLIHDMGTAVALGHAEVGEQEGHRLARILTSGQNRNWGSGA
jgi:hypothetical protein